LNNLLLEPKLVHFLSDFVYLADKQFRDHRMANPQSSVNVASYAAGRELARRLRNATASVDDKNFSLLHAKSGLFNIDLLSGFGFIARGTGSRTNELILVTRGTNFEYNKFDLATNANVGYGIGPRGHVFHRGFLKTFKSYQNQLVNFVSQHGTNRPATIHCMGHSLGGALANLNACLLQDAGFHVCLYTIGAPRVGLVGYAQDITKRIPQTHIRRIANPCDPVPMVPVFPYAHASRGQSELLVHHGEKIGIDAHLLHSGYSKMAYSSSWSDFAPVPHTLSRRDDLARQFASLGGGGMFNAKLLDLISQLTRHVLLDFGNAALITLQGVLSVAFTAVDLLAEALMKAANATRLMAEEVYSIVNSMLGFLGRAPMKGTDINLNTLRWVLSQFSMEMAGRAQQAMLKAQAGK